MNLEEKIEGGFFVAQKGDTIVIQLEENLASGTREKLKQILIEQMGNTDIKVMLLEKPLNVIGIIKAP